MTNVTHGAERGAAGSERSTTEQAKERMGETAQQVGEKAQEVRGKAGERVRQELDTRSSQAGEQVSSTADAIRRVGEQLRNDGKTTPARYADQIAERAERLGRYLTEADADRMLRDAENFGRRQPWLAAVGGAALGFLASRFVKASSVKGSEQAYSGNGARRPELTTGAVQDPPMASFSSAGGPSPQPTAGRSEGRGEV